MTRFDPYLNFDGKTEEAFNFYKSVFGGESATVIRFKDMPIEDVSLPKGEADKIMHIGLPIGRDQVLMGTELLESLGQKLVMGNNLHISIQPDSKEEADRLFDERTYAGQRTDRGTLFVYYGEPKEIRFEAAPKGRGEYLEVWEYGKDIEPGLDGRQPETLYYFVKKDGHTTLYKGPRGRQVPRSRIRQ